MRRPPARSAMLIAPLVVIVAGLGPLALGGPDRPRPGTALPAPYWARAVHVVAPNGDSSGLVKVTAFSFLGFQPDAEALPPGGAIDAGGEIIVTETRCRASRCRDEVHRGIITPAQLAATGDVTTLRATVGGCIVDLTWTATARSGPPPDSVDNSVIPPWYRRSTYWHATATGTLCDWAVSSDQAFVA